MEIENKNTNEKKFKKGEWVRSEYKKKKTIIDYYL